MQQIIGVRFRAGGKPYYFDPGDLTLEEGEKVIVETSRGIEIGETAIPNRMVPEEELVLPLKQVVRKATKEDMLRLEANLAKEEAAFKLCEQRILYHKLEMQLVNVEFAFDGSRILFNFTSDNRVDFRDLVKDLASAFHTRIELRQIGVRDESKLLGGLGICGRPFCCHEFMSDFMPVSIKMAKEQLLSLNPGKISGTCGRLMCCLRYEHEAYEELHRITPRVGAQVETPQGKGTVTEATLLTGALKVSLDKNPENPKEFHRNEVHILKNAPRGNDTLPAYAADTGDDSL